jgi:hypothetical protein
VLIDFAEEKDVPLRFLRVYYDHVLHGWKFAFAFEVQMIAIVTFLPFRLLVNEFCDLFLGILS